MHGLGSMYSNFINRGIPPDVRIHHVPVLADSEWVDQIEYEDLSAKEIIAKIDNTKHIQKICSNNFSPLLACRTIREMSYE